MASQLRQLPGDATHLVISVGGNDALFAAGVLDEPALSVANALTKLAEVVEAFSEDYVLMLKQASGLSLPTAVCTIYEPRFADAFQQRIAVTALKLFNDEITRRVFSRSLTLIDLRLICNEEADFANLIEPSERGGAKIAEAISMFCLGATPHSCVFSRHQ
jgi:hypothetical protein